MSITDRWKDDFKNEYFGEISEYESLKHGGSSHNQQDHDPHKGTIGKYPLAKKEIKKAPKGYLDKIEVIKDLNIFQKIIPDKSLKVEDFIFNAFEYSDAISGIYTKVYSVKPLPDATSGFSVKGKIYDDKGGAIGIFSRKIYSDGTIEQESLTMDIPKRGLGFGKRFYQNQEETYTSAGFKEIKIHANMSVGGYAWARMGYDFATKSTKYSTALAKMYGQKFQTSMPFKFKHPWEIASYIDPTGEAMGKKVMLGSNWMAIKKLDVNDEGYQIGRAYYNAESSKKSLVYGNMSASINIAETITFDDTNAVKLKMIDNSVITDNNQNTIKHAHHDQSTHNPHKGAIRSASSSFRKQFKSVNYMNEQNEVIKRPFTFNMPDKDVDALDYIHSAYNYYDKETNLVSEVLEIWKTEDNRLNIQGTINDADDDNIGFFSVLLDDKGSIEFEELHLDTQSQGFGKRFYENMELTSEKGGFKEITLQANMDVGGYAWARMGFDFNEPSMSLQFGESFSKKYKSLYGNYPPVFPEHSWEIASYQGPDGRKVGKEFMLGSNWNGVKKLSSDNIGYQIGKSYYDADSNTKSYGEDLGSSLKHPGHGTEKVHGHRGGLGLGGGSYEQKCRKIINKPKSDYVDMSIQDGETVSESDIHDMLSKVKEYNDWNRRLSVTEINTILEYTGSGYRPMNSFLRGIKDTVFGEDGWTKEVSIMDNAISKSTIHQDMILRRGMTILTSIPKESAVYNQIASLKEGDIWSDKAFLSTGVGEGFQGARIQLELRVPKGTVGAYVQFDNLTGELENEAILPREIPLYINSVVSIKHPTYGNQLIVDATVLPKP